MTTDIPGDTTEEVATSSVVSAVYSQRDPQSTEAEVYASQDKGYLYSTTDHYLTTHGYVNTVKTILYPAYHEERPTQFPIYFIVIIVVLVGVPLILSAICVIKYFLCPYCLRTEKEETKKQPEWVNKQKWLKRHESRESQISQVTTSSLILEESDEFKCSRPKSNSQYMSSNADNRFSLKNALSRSARMSSSIARMSLTAHGPGSSSTWDLHPALDPNVPHEEIIMGPPGPVTKARVPQSDQPTKSATNHVFNPETMSIGSNTSLCAIAPVQD